jgi:dimethylglycine dehydrogenase
VGRINLTYALSDAGTTRTEYTIVRMAENEYYLISAGAWTAYDAGLPDQGGRGFQRRNRPIR